MRKQRAARQPGTPAAGIRQQSSAPRISPLAKTTKASLAAPSPDELPTSETGSDRSEVFPIMATAAASNNTRASREVVEFPPNVPVTVALKYGHAKTVSSQYGERFMFSSPMVA